MKPRKKPADKPKQKIQKPKTGCCLKGTPYACPKHDKGVQ